MGKKKFTGNPNAQYIYAPNARQPRRNGRRSRSWSSYSSSPPQDEWYDGQVNGEQARVRERSDGKIDALTNYTGEYNNSPHDHTITTTDGMNVEHLREDDIVIIDGDDPEDAYPDMQADAYKERRRQQRGKS